MALKPKLIVVGHVISDQVKHISWAVSPHLRGQLEHWFDFEIYDSSRHYPYDTWFVMAVWCYEKLRDQFKDRRVIIDVCLEANMPKWDRIGIMKQPHHVVMYGSVGQNSGQEIYVPNFFWWYEAGLQLPHYQPKRNPQKKFVMPVGRKTAWRDQIIAALETELEQAYWSYVRRGRALPYEPDSVPGAKRWNTRYDNPRWYDETGFSLVLESITDWNSAVPFVTEKTFKPIRHQHPFMIVGAPGLLSFLRSQGFETFDSMWDETYDHTADLDVKIAVIKNNIHAWQWNHLTAQVLQQLEHNQQWFLNQRILTDSIQKTLVNPVLEIIESR